MSKKPKGEVAKRRRKRIDESQEGIVWREEKDEEAVGGKIIFLDKENLEKLRGYKAFFNLWRNGEVSLTLTGLSLRSAYSLFDSLTQMKDEEIHEK